MVKSNVILAMIEKAKKALKNAYVPIDNFRVGCCLYTNDEKFYSGCNIEVTPISLTLCAETVAIGCMIADAGERKIIDVVIMSDKVDECPPCGSCRQRLLEFADTNTTIHLVSKNGNVIKSLPLVALLPEPFIWKKV